jgi:hypothetical protein
LGLSVDVLARRLEDFPQEKEETHTERRPPGLDRLDRLDMAESVVARSKTPTTVTTVSLCGGEHPRSARRKEQYRKRNGPYIATADSSKDREALAKPDRHENQLHQSACVKEQYRKCNDTIDLQFLDGNVTVSAVGSSRYHPVALVKPDRYENQLLRSARVKEQYRKRNDTIDLQFLDGNVTVSAVGSSRYNPVALAKPDRYESAQKHAYSQPSVSVTETYP